MFIHVSIMIFVGFGFLMTFLKRYGYSAIGYNFMLSCFAFLWNVLVRLLQQFHVGFTAQCAGFWEHVYHRSSDFTIRLSFPLMTEGMVPLCAARTILRLITALLQVCLALAP
jgi:hypothetical protein